MSRTSVWMIVCLLLICCAVPALAQQPAAVTNISSSAVVPSLVSFSGALKDDSGKAMTGVVGVTFALYKEAQGGAPLWLETQNVYPDKTGHYKVQLGAASTAGLPAEVFVGGEARWLGVQVQGQAEQPRVSLVSVPYALKAGDAQTVGGLPASAFVLASPVMSPGTASASSSAAAQTPLSPDALAPATPVTTAGGTANKLAKFDAASDIANSIVFDNGTNVGINTTSPSARLDVNGSSAFRGTANMAATGTATAAGGKNSNQSGWTASVFNSGTGTAVPQVFRLQVEPVGNNTATTSGTLNVLYATGSNIPAETGLKIASNGRITFAAGQAFPGTGTVSNVATGLGLTGGPITTTGTLAIDTTVVPRLAASNSFTGDQTVTGNISASGTVSGASLVGSTGAITNSLTVGTNLSVGGTINGGRGVLITQLLGNSGFAPATGYLNLITNYIPPVNATAFTYNRCSWGTTAAGQTLDFRSAIRTPTGGSEIIGNAFYVFPSSAGTETLYNENNDFFTLTAGQSYDFGINSLSSTGGNGTCSTMVQIFSN